ncbi:hypothetical protein OS493_012168 [Desmophyllum pertusum]|uniref:BRISC complex subunit Abro1 n=1 Tax=Desmophyllum pertusum TaxID=174260 RepID=A0A9X0A6G1_9CNID|nr:hypothetical protein OS493_012168 [Desmophyllum pertusum]
MEVCMSGCVFSSLVYELENNEGDVEGLLLGQITSRIVNTITDTQSENLKHERVATIQGFVPFGKVHSFYTSAGNIVNDTVSEELNNDNEKTEKVIGWFKFRRNTQGQVSMRERFIHHNLIEKFQLHPCQRFCCSAHKGGLFEPVQVKILNLGDTSHSEYRLNCHSAQATSCVFHEVIDSYRGDFVDNKGCIQQSTHMHGMYITMMKKLQDLVEVVKNSETTVSSLTEEVESRRKQLEECRLQLANKNVPCEVNEKRPLQPNSVSNQSNQETEKDSKTVDEQRSEMPVEDNKNNDGTASPDNNPVETNDHGVTHEKEDALEEKPRIDSTHLTRRRKQKTPAKVAHYANLDNDDDITDDETQTYSTDENIQGNGAGYEERISHSLAMESSSPVF